MLIAHEMDAELSDDTFQAIVASVPRELEIDAYCVISGRVGFRCRAENDKEAIDLLNGTHLYGRDYGNGALAAFLLVSISVLNGIQLGDQSFFPYLKYLP